MWWDNWLKSTQNVLLYRCACDNLTLLVGKVIQATVSDIVFFRGISDIVAGSGVPFPGANQEGGGRKNAENEAQLNG